jgi:hypothetical protein
LKFEFTLEIDGLPQMTNPSGRRTHWVLKMREAQKWKQIVLAAVRRAGPAPIKLPVEKAQLRCTRFSSVCPDPDGLVSGFKHIIDGLVAAEVLKNDRISNIGFPNYDWERVPPGHGKIRVVLILDEDKQPPQQELPLEK